MMPIGPFADLTDRQLLNSVDRSHPEVRELARRFEDAIESEYIVRELLKAERAKNARKAPIRDALEARARAAGQVS
jgi:hypothetical protein